jgi:predicted ATP-grasp superfamily ATP-dependent carboligase
MSILDDKIFKSIKNEFIGGHVTHTPGYNTTINLNDSVMNISNRDIRIGTKTPLDNGTTNDIELIADGQHIQQQILRALDNIRTNRVNLSIHQDETAQKSVKIIYANGKAANRLINDYKILKGIIRKDKF